MVTPQDILAQVAHSFIGTTDKRMIDEFRRAVYGRAVGQSWCLDFVWYCVAQVIAQHHDVKVTLPTTELTSHLWDHASAASKGFEPQRGHIAVWNRTGTIHGHCGIVHERLSDEYFLTIEGNTYTKSSPDRGVWLKSRNFKSNGFITLCGFVNPFVETVLPSEQSENQTAR